MSLTYPALNQAACEQIHYALRSELRRLNQTVEDCLRQEDSEAGIHRLRVRTRRLRSLLKTARACLPKKIYALQRHYAKLARASNTERDRQVLRLRLQQWSQQHDEIRDACELLQQSLATQGDETRSGTNHQAQAYLAQYQRLNRKLAKRLTGWKQVRERRKLRLAEYLVELLTQHRVLWQQYWQAWLDGDEYALHQLRLEVKHLRYALLPWSKAVPEWQHWYQFMEDLQNELGNAHDFIVQTQLLQQHIPIAAQAYFITLLERQIQDSLSQDSAQALLHSSRDLRFEALAGCHVLLPFLRHQQQAHLDQLKVRMGPDQLKECLSEMSRMAAELVQQDVTDE